MAKRKTAEERLAEACLEMGFNQAEKYFIFLKAINNPPVMRKPKKITEVKAAG